MYSDSGNATPGGDRSFNDDRAELSSRRLRNTDSSRQPLASVARDTITRVFTPQRSQRGDPQSHTPSRRQSHQVTPTRRTSDRLVPVQADFDQWMGLIRNNRINAANSWNFPLIDYFHDLSVLKDGNTINFQKASYTLDGCIKVYSSRVDSVSNETNKLLTGLVANSVQEVEVVDQESPGDEQSDIEEETISKRRKKTRKRSTNFLPSEKLQMNIEELANTIDPLFRKMCADFDEGGAKGLLLNGLVADQHGMIAFGGDEDEEIAAADDDDENDLDFIRTDALGKTSLETISEENEEEEEQDKIVDIQDTLGEQAESRSSATFLLQDDDIRSGSQADAAAYPSVDLARYGVRYHIEAEALAGLDVCPSLPLIEAAINDPKSGTEHLIKDIEAWSLSDVNADGEEDYQADLPDYGDDFPEVLDQDPHTSMMSAWESADATENASFFEPSVWDVTAYFEEHANKNWAGPEHWKVQRIKSKPSVQSTIDVQPTREEARSRFTRAKRQQSAIINFTAAEGVDITSLFAPGRAIDLPKRKSPTSGTDTTYRLPEDMHITAKSFVRLFLRPDGRPATAYQRIQRNDSAQPATAAEDEDGFVNGAQAANDEFWAELADLGNVSGHGAGAYDADFYAENQDNMVPDSQFSQAEPAPLSQLIRRPDQLNFAKSARKVNVRQLKANMWEAVETLTGSSPDATQLRFSEIVENTGHKYRQSQLADLTPSLYFINILHLANEHGLNIVNTPGYRDLAVGRGSGPVNALAFGASAS